MRGGAGGMCGARRGGRGRCSRWWALWDPCTSCTLCKVCKVLETESPERSRQFFFADCFSEKKIQRATGLLPSRTRANLASHAGPLKCTRPCPKGTLTRVAHAAPHREGARPLLEPRVAHLAAPAQLRDAPLEPPTCRPSALGCSPVPLRPRPTREDGTTDPPWAPGAARALHRRWRAVWPIGRHGQKRATCAPSGVGGRAWAPRPRRRGHRCGARRASGPGYLWAVQRGR